MQDLQGNYATGTPQNATTEQPRQYAGEIATPMPALALESRNVMRSLAIRQLDYGYMVEVGCQVFAIESASVLIAKLSEYILNPAATEAKYREGKLF